MKAKKDTVKVYRRAQEAGNALFLILIAVTLFAALSYAVTQSNRSSGQSASEEANLIASSQVTQYPSGIRTGITRMLIKGTGVSELTFNAPGSYGGDATVEVFHPSGGGVVFQSASPDVVADPATDVWVFRDDVAITDMATTSDDVVAMLPGLRLGVCQSINEQVTGSTAVPVLTGTEANLLAGTVDIDDGNTSSGTVDGRPFLCVETSDGEYVYYHVLVEQ